MERGNGWAGSITPCPCYLEQGYCGSGNARLRGMIVQCVRSVWRFWQSHQFSDGTLHKSAFKLCISHDANQRSCLSICTIAKQAVAKHTSHVLFYGCGTTLAMMLMMLMHQCELFRTDGRTDEQMEVIGEPEVNPTPNSFSG